jgi:F0F1-type ATP synthase membrane subunit a
MTSFLLAAADPMDEVLPHTLFPLGPFGFTNQVLMCIISAALMLLIFPALFARASSSPPTGTKNFFESIMEFLRVEVFRPALKEHTDRFVPFLWTLFFFILFANLLGQIPMAEIIGLFTPHTEWRFWGTATGTPITTGALAICAFVFIHLSGVMQVAKSLMDGTYGHHGHHQEHSANGAHGHEAAQDLEHMRGDAIAADVPGDFRALTNPSAHYADDLHPGSGRPRSTGRHDSVDDEPIHHVNPVLAVLLAVPLYLWNFAPHPFKPAEGVSGIKAFFMWVFDVPMFLILLALELLGAVIKPFSLTIRLFANMIAGHIVLGSLVLLIPLTATFAHQLAIGAPITILSLVIRVLELFVAFLQAYIFTFLVTLFIASAVAPEH